MLKVIEPVGAGMEVKSRGAVRSGCFCPPQPCRALRGLLPDTTGQKERGRTKKPQEPGARLNEREPFPVSLSALQGGSEIARRPG